MELQKLEGTTLSVGCLYSWRQSSAEKIWGRKASVNVYSILATTFWTWDPRYSIQDYPKSNSFVVTITGLRVQDSGFYACGLSEGGQIYVLKTLHLVVSKGEFSSVSFMSLCLLESADARAGSGEDPRNPSLQPSWLKTEARGHPLVKGRTSARTQARWFPVHSSTPQLPLNTCVATSGPPPFV